MDNFIDVSVAFDTVDYYLLLDKLCVNSYFHHRCQCVSYQGSQSDFMIMEKGGPQGSFLRSLLFSIAINDLPQICFDCHIQLYASDTVIYSSKPDIS